MEERYGFKPEYFPNAPTQEPPFNTDPSALSYPQTLPPPYPSSSYPPLNPPIGTDSSNLLYPPPPPHSNNDSNQAYRWVDTAASHGVVPTTALQGGIDVDGHPIYVGKAYHEGDWIPAKVIPSRNVAYIAYDGEEHAVEHFQILCEQRFDWVQSQGGYLPPGAVQGGQTSDGEPLYIGRAYHEGSQTIGKIHPSHGALYIPFGGKEIAYHNYETLVLRS